MATSGEQMIKFKSSDGEILSIPEEIANRSKTIEDMLKMTEDLDQSESFINYEAKTLNFVFDWLKRHPNRESPERDTKRFRPSDYDNDAEIVLPPLDLTSFQQMTLAEVYKVMQAANFLHIQPLLECVSKYFARCISENEDYKNLTRFFHELKGKVQTDEAVAGDQKPKPSPKRASKRLSTKARASTSMDTQ